MSRKTKRTFLILTLILMLSGCSGPGSNTKSMDGDDGFYQWGKGKRDWIHRY